MKKQLIDADALIRFMNERHKTLVDVNGWYDHYTSGYEDAITDVEEAPVVDAVAVVRCKECKFFCPYEDEEHMGDCAELVGLERYVYEDDYCSYGEKRVGEEEDE